MPDKKPSSNHQTSFFTHPKFNLMRSLNALLFMATVMDYCQNECAENESHLSLMFVTLSIALTGYQNNSLIHFANVLSNCYRLGYARGENEVSNLFAEHAPDCQERPWVGSAIQFILFANIMQAFTGFFNNEAECDSESSAAIQKNK